MTDVEVALTFTNNAWTLVVNVSCDSGIEKVKVWSKFGRVPMIRKPPSECPQTFEIVLTPYPSDWMPVTVDVLCCGAGAKWDRKAPFKGDGTQEGGSTEPDPSKPPGEYKPPPPKVPGEKKNGQEDE